MSPNPFFAKRQVPPEHFVGRTSEIASAFDQIYNRSHLAIWGGLGMGKTSFLEKVASPQAWIDHGLDPSTAVIVLLRCEDLHPFTPAAFWQEVLKLFHEKLDSEPQLQVYIKSLLEKAPVTNDSLRQALRRLERENKFLALLVDDFDVSLVLNEQYTEAERETFLAQCRSLAVGGRYLSMIVTSLNRLNELGPKVKANASPWYNHYLFQSLKLFADKDLDQLLTIIRPAELRDAIRDMTGRHPTLVQIAGFFLYRELQRQQEADVNAFAEGFERDTQEIFQTIWSRCDEIDQTLLMLIALLALQGRLNEKHFDLSGIGRIFTQDERRLTNLEQQGIITSKLMEERKFYFFTSSIMEKWVIQEILNTKEAELKKREKVFLNLMSHGQVEQFKKAITWLWQNKDAVPSLLDWFAKVVAAFPKGLI
ncbi:ATP-binding protein [Aulosira sp. FACHB-615]|uniref:ATP-binding protein n=1 Tax=Aulosira sp. FACHB-615 TaxID=2692777 RepID=UPI0016888551|nr:ATP-binding protein [Aulosira sp. FACHB-615]MBD2487471.1 ATP-binding protein [Aulosira sp. FACHB-615]